VSPYRSLTDAHCLEQAAVKASSDNAPTVRASHFLWAQERIQMGAARKSAIITDEDKLATAYHEGGHAVRPLSLSPPFQD
jgi:ATP-dependent metalloprotease